jgi:hypothetical protein
MPKSAGQCIATDGNRGRWQAAVATAAMAGLLVDVTLSGNVKAMSFWGNGFVLVTDNAVNWAGLLHSANTGSGVLVVGVEDLVDVEVVQADATAATIRTMVNTPGRRFIVPSPWPQPSTWPDVRDTHELAPHVREPSVRDGDHRPQSWRTPPVRCRRFGTATPGGD